MPCRTPGKALGRIVQYTVEQAGEALVFRVSDDLQIEMGQEGDEIVAVVFGLGLQVTADRGHKHGCADTVAADVTQ